MYKRLVNVAFKKFNVVSLIAIAVACVVRYIVACVSWSTGLGFTHLTAFFSHVGMAYLFLTY